MATLIIFMNAYFIGLFSALNFENGMITKASNAKIKIAYTI